MSEEQKALDRAHWLSEDLMLEAGWIEEKKLNQIMNEEFTALTGFKAGIKSESLEVTTDRKIIIDEMIYDELRDSSLRLSNWRNKYNWKYFAVGGDRSDKPFKD